MALYSVWNWDKNVWAIYQDSRPVSVGDDPKPPRPVNVSILGVDPDTQMNPLPSDAKFVGFDHMCRGEVRVAGGMLSGLGLVMPETGDLTKYVMGALVGGGVVYWWRRRR